MIEIRKIREIVEQEIAETDKFIVDVKLNAGNQIDIVLDSDKVGGVSIDDCAKISRTVENSLNRDEDDFELQVASAGLDQPIKLFRQYKKNIGNNVDIVFTNGNKITAKLVSATDTAIEAEYEVKELLEGKKRKQLVKKTEKIQLSDLKSVKLVVSFK